MIYVYTPSHNARGLLRAYQSLVRQTKSDWKWLLLLNGKLHRSMLPAEILEDARVNVCETDRVSSVGALKQEACVLALQQQETQLLVELDHDDELRSDCLERLWSEYTAKPDGFYYSDFCEFKPDGSPQVYGSYYGWSSYGTSWEGQSVTAMRAKQVTARSLYQIFYAPNHVRAWSRSAYEKSGGYDAKYDVCDDHDLLVRTYLAGVEMHHIPECLYMQHGSPQQTQVTRNNHIQTVQAKIGASNLDKLCAEWARREKLKCLDMGAAHNPAPGYLTVDKHGGDFTLDVTEGLPFADSSIGVIRAFDFLEHIPLGKVVPFMNECWRVLAPGGWLLTSTPSTDGRGAFQDPTHVSFWNANSFWYYTQRDQSKYVPEITCSFQLTRIHNYFPSNWHMENNIPYVAADLWVLKGQERCGPDLISKE